MTLETAIKVSISRFTNQTRFLEVSIYRQYLVFACLKHLHLLVLFTRSTGFPVACLNILILEEVLNQIVL